MLVQQFTVECGGVGYLGALQDGQSYCSILACVNSGTFLVPLKPPVLLQNVPEQM